MGLFGRRKKKAPRRKPKRAKRAKRTKKRKKVKKRRGGKKKAFGGYSVSFARVEDVPVGKVFGTKPMPPSMMTKKLWKFVKARKLGGKR